jgi:hypothetical protein
MKYPYFEIQQSSIEKDKHLPYDKSLSDAAKLLIQRFDQVIPISEHERDCHKSRHGGKEEEEEECQEEEYTVGYLLKKNTQTLDQLKYQIEEAKQVLPNFHLESIHRVDFKHEPHHEGEEGEEGAEEEEGSIIYSKLNCFGEEGLKNPDCEDCQNLFKYPPSYQNSCPSKHSEEEEEQEQEHKKQESHTTHLDDDFYHPIGEADEEEENNHEEQSCFDCLDQHIDIANQQHLEKYCPTCLTPHDRKCLNRGKDECDIKKGCKWCEDPKGKTDGFCLSENNPICPASTHSPRSPGHESKDDIDPEGESLHPEEFAPQEEEHETHHSEDSEDSEDPEDHGDEHQSPEDHDDEHQDPQKHHSDQEHPYPEHSGVSPTPSQHGSSSGPTRQPTPSRPGSSGKHQPDSHDQPTFAPTPKSAPGKTGDTSGLGPKDELPECLPNSLHLTNCNEPICCQHKENKVFYQYQDHKCGNNAFDSDCCDTHVEGVEVCRNPHKIKEHFDFENPVSMVKKCDITSTHYLLFAVLVLICYLIYRQFC